MLVKIPSPAPLLISSLVLTAVTNCLPQRSAPCPWQAVAQPHLQGFAAMF